MVLVEYWGFGVRHVQLLLLVICGLVGAILTHTLNVAIYMVEVNLNSNNYTLFDDEFRFQVKKYTYEQKYILKNGMTVGRFAACLIAGLFSTRGDQRKLKYFLLLDFAVLSILSYLIPLVTIKVNYNYMFFMVLLQGFLYGLIFPTITAILARWTPYQEVGRTCTLVLSSRYLGHLCIYVLGLFLRTSIGGWHTLFYIVGNLGLLWCVAWFTFGFQDPKGCFYLSEKEREFIQNNITNISSSHYPRKHIPWTNIFSCLPLYAALVAQVSYAWLYEMIADTTLTVDFWHYHNILDLDTSMSVLYLVPAAIPIVQFVAALVVDAIIGKNKFPITFIRKTCNSIGSWSMTLALLWLCYDPDDGAIEITFYIIIIYSNAFVNLGSKMVVYDITRDYSGLLDGLIGFVVHLPMVFFIPIMRPILPVSGKSRKDREYHYSILWYTCAASSFIGNFSFIVMKTRNKILKSERQPRTKRTSIFDWN